MNHNGHVFSSRKSTALLLSIFIVYPAHPTWATPIIDDKGESKTVILPELNFTPLGIHYTPSGTLSGVHSLENTPRLALQGHGTTNSSPNTGGQANINSVIEQDVLTTDGTASVPLQRGNTAPPLTEFSPHGYQTVSALQAVPEIKAEQGNTVMNMMRAGTTTSTVELAINQIVNQVALEWSAHGGMPSLASQTVSPKAGPESQRKHPETAQARFQWIKIADLLEDTKTLGQATRQKRALTEPQSQFGVSSRSASVQPLLTPLSTEDEKSSTSSEQKNDPIVLNILVSEDNHIQSKLIQRALSLMESSIQTEIKAGLATLETHSRLLTKELADAKAQLDKIQQESPLHHEAGLPVDVVLRSNLQAQIKTVQVQIHENAQKIAKRLYLKKTIGESKLFLNCFYAKNGQEAVDFFEQRLAEQIATCSQVFDICLSDYQMPLLTGGESCAIRRSRELDTGIPLTPDRFHSTNTDVVEQVYTALQEKLRDYLIQSSELPRMPDLVSPEDRGEMLEILAQYGIAFVSGKKGNESVGLNNDVLVDILFTILKQRENPRLRLQFSAIQFQHILMEQIAATREATPPVLSLEVQMPRTAAAQQLPPTEPTAEEQATQHFGSLSIGTGRNGI